MKYQRSLTISLELILLTSLITFGKGAYTLLTVEGGVSLVGPHCPGTVRLFCKGVELSILRWRYNGDMDIILYFSDRTSSTQPTESSFFMPQLTTVEQNPENPNLANFSSYLVVNFSQLQFNNVTDISCGSPGVSQIDSEPVNVSIIEPGVPNSPTITMVTAAYQSGKLNSVEVTWEKSDNFCPSYGFSLVYEVNLTAYDSIAVNHLSMSNCNEVVCMISFNNLTGRTEEQFAISIKADNELGSGDLIFYPTSIADQIQEYFLPEVFLVDRQLAARCTTAAGFVRSGVCIVQYTTDPMYKNLSNETTAPLNTELSLLEVTQETMYYFQFSVLLNNSLKITDRVTFRFSVQTGVPSWGIAIIVIFVIMTIMITAITMIVVTMILFRRTKNSKKPVSESGEMKGAQETAIKDQSFFRQTTDNRKELFSESVEMESTRETAIKAQSVGDSAEVSTAIDNLQQHQSVEQSDSSVAGDIHDDKHLKQDQGQARDRKNHSEDTNLPSKEEDRCPVVSIEGHELRAEQKKVGNSRPYTVYKILITFQDQTRVIFKRYNDFKKLFNDVKEKYPLEVKHLKFPEKRRVKDNLDDGFIEGRQRALHNIMINLMKIPDIQKFPPVQEFLALSDQLPTDHHHEAMERSSNEGDVHEAKKQVEQEKKDIIVESDHEEKAVPQVFKKL